MHFATTPAEQQQWMLQWRSAAVALEELRRKELRELTDEKAREISQMLLSAAPIPGDPRNKSTTSGFVEQQRIFAKARSR